MYTHAVYFRLCINLEIFKLNLLKCLLNFNILAVVNVVL